MSFGLSLPPHHRVFAAFALHALAMGSIFPRLPEIQRDLGVSEGTLGLALIGVPVGCLASLTFATPLLERLGFRHVLLAAIPLVALTFAIAVQAANPVALFALLVPAGALIGCVEIVVNVEADRTEALIGRRIMNRAHAFWSMGFFAAGLFGAAMGHIGISPQLHLALIVPIAAAAVALFLGKYTAAPLRAATETQASSKLARPTFAIMLLVGVTLSAMLMEGAGMDWSAIYMHKLFAAGPFLAGSAVATIALSQGLCRYFADGFVEAQSPVLVARVLLSMLAVGLLCLVAAASPGLSMLGFALLGAGTSAIFPLAMSAAAQRTDRPASINVAALAQISFVAFLFGPPLLGFVAQHWGIQWAYGIGLPFVALSFWTSSALQPESASK